MHFNNVSALWWIYVYSAQAFGALLYRKVSWFKLDVNGRQVSTFQPPYLFYSCDERGWTGAWGPHVSKVSWSECKLFCCGLAFTSSSTAFSLLCMRCHSWLLAWQHEATRALQSAAPVSVVQCCPIQHRGIYSLHSTPKLWSCDMWTFFSKFREGRCL